MTAPSRPTMADIEASRRQVLVGWLLLPVAWLLWAVQAAAVAARRTR